MNKSMVVLERAKNSAAGRVFYQGELERDPVVSLTLTEWKDFGCPDEITVTIEPGHRIT